MTRFNKAFTKFCKNVVKQLLIFNTYLLNNIFTVQFQHFYVLKINTYNKKYELSQFKNLNKQLDKYFVAMIQNLKVLSA